MHKQDMTSIKRLLLRNIKALNAKDIEGLLANQQPGAELVIPGGVTLHGHEQIRQYAEAFGQHFRMVPSRSQVRFWLKMQRLLSSCLWARTLVRWPRPMV